jgi:hypothetical protein
MLELDVGDLTAIARAVLKAAMCEHGVALVVDDADGYFLIGVQLGELRFASEQAEYRHGGERLKGYPTESEIEH